MSSIAPFEDDGIVCLEISDIIVSAKGQTGESKEPRGGTQRVTEKVSLREAVTREEGLGTRRAANLRRRDPFRDGKEKGVNSRL